MLNKDLFEKIDSIFQGLDCSIPSIPFLLFTNRTPLVPVAEVVQRCLTRPTPFIVKLDEISLFIPHDVITICCSFDLLHDREDGWMGILRKWVLAEIRILTITHIVEHDHLADTAILIDARILDLFSIFPKFQHFYLRFPRESPESPGLFLTMYVNEQCVILIIFNLFCQDILSTKNSSIKKCQLNLTKTLKFDKKLSRFVV